MPSWSQSHFLQSLGWATINSFWQMAILWILFCMANAVIKFSSQKKYTLSVMAVCIGFAIFVASLFLYSDETTLYFFRVGKVWPSAVPLLQTAFFAAALTYLLLLTLPAIRLFKNWRFLQTVKKTALQKADVTHRLFVKQIAMRLGIRKKVKIAVSHLISSPATIGYFKPLILLPVAALNNLTTSQVESVLLHELAHIRRYDYLVNLLVSFIQTFMYFNPFINFFIRNIEDEREVCCDELVLQFGYDKISYASALLYLEKAAVKVPVLAIGAVHKNLLNRIEKIVGMEKKKTFRLMQLLPVIAAFACAIFFNSLLIIKDKVNTTGLAFNETALTPWQFGKQLPSATSTPLQNLAKASKTPLTQTPSTLNIQIATDAETPATANTDEGITTGAAPVTFDEVDGTLSDLQKQNVSEALTAAKSFLTTSQWKDVEAGMADILTQKQKSLVRQQYLQEVNKINWKNIEKNLKANYNNLDWKTINANISQAMKQVRLDSLQQIFAIALKELQSVQKDVVRQSQTTISPLPDASVAEIKMAEETLRENIDSIKKLSTKKIIRL